MLKKLEESEKLAFGLKMIVNDYFFCKICLIFNDSQKRLKRLQKPDHMVNLGKRNENSCVSVIFSIIYHKPALLQT